MGESFKIIRGEDRFKGSVNVDSTIKIPLDSTIKELDEFDRTQVINSYEVFEQERQRSNNFRVASKIDFIFKNTIVGNSNYDRFQKNLYYINETSANTQNQLVGYPQYYEFDFIRRDFDVDGYTSGNYHVMCLESMSSKYNWMVYLTYVSENDSLKRFNTYFNDISFEWVANQGIPFIIQRPININGVEFISFQSNMEHGLKAGDYVEVTINNVSRIIQVYSLGNGGYGSDKFIFNIIDIDYSYFNDGEIGTLRRISDINNIEESKSEYYVRKHKVLTNFDDYVLVNNGFARNGFDDNRKLLLKELIYQDNDKIVIKEENHQYLVTFKRDIDVSPYVDNLNRPITELFVTIINRGYFGWFNRPDDNVDYGTLGGFKFNLVDRDFWDITNRNFNNTELRTDFYLRNNKEFFYNKELSIDDVIYGDFCEFNKLDQTERVISDRYHKIVFNKEHFQVQGSDRNDDGYYYKPHYSVPIRAFSDYIETGEVTDLNIPDYAFYSNTNDRFIWRDVYNYGFIDNSGNGVDYPFINKHHHPTSNVIFRLIGEGFTKKSIGVVQIPIIDGCE